MRKVPHCKECSDLDIYTIGKHNYYNCYNKEVYAFNIVGKAMYSRFIKTSPEWCPKRRGTDK